MGKIINIWGIETNNLKNIDIEIEQNTLNLIVGPSGSGKSSLAYDTIAQIGQHEYLSMFADDISEPTYRIKGYKNMLAAVPIKQSNFNNNLRSTIGTYFGINRSINFIYSSILGVDENLFVLNKEENACNECHGLGYIRTLDKNRLINYDIPLEKNPIRCWNRYKDFYSQIIQQFCLDNNIDSKKTFRQLTDEEKRILLYGESEKKYSIRFKKNSNFSRRTTKYYGIMSGIPMIVDFKPATRFFTEETCNCCKGTKFTPEYEQFKVLGLSIGAFMTTPFEQLQHYIDKLISGTTDATLLFALNKIQKFILKAIELKLGYLFFHRAIPTLSGGELQRLRMVQVLGAQLSNLLLVLDEPLAGLSGEEKYSVYQCVVELAHRHTVVIVDHSDLFVDISNKVIALGEGGGTKGGFMINAEKYLAKQKISKTIMGCPVKKLEQVSIKNRIYSYEGVEIEIAKECMNLITGHSGIGKTTLLREYFPQYFEYYLYINQKPMLGNKNSSVATLLDISIEISNLFAEKCKKDRKFFSNQTGCEGMCPICKGAGYVEYGNGYESKMKLLCKECLGTGFNKKLLKYKVNGKNIFQVWNMTIDEATDYFRGIDKITDILKEASTILLGHLKIGQPAATLSGGENIRVKLLKGMKSTAKVFGVDEPFKGLNNTEIYRVAQYLDRLRHKGKTIIVVDHSEGIEQYFERHIELVCNSGILEGCIR